MTIGNLFEDEDALGEFHCCREINVNIAQEEAVAIPFVYGRESQSQISAVIRLKLHEAVHAVKAEEFITRKFTLVAAKV